MHRTFEWTRVTPICNIEASPEATVEWYKDGQRMEEEGFVVTDWLIGCVGRI